MMDEEYTFHARQYVDFSKDDDLPNDSFFDHYLDENVATQQNAMPQRYEVVTEPDYQYISSPESEKFFSPLDDVPTSTIYLKSSMRRSLSMNNLAIDKPQETHLSSHSEEPPRPNSVNGAHSGISKAPSQNAINRLAQPKRFTSTENCTLAEAVNKFQVSTPKRFRTKPSLKTNKAMALPSGNTEAHSPKLMTTTRNRPTAVLSKEEQEKLEMEEAKKFKIKANPVNRKVLRGPMKPQIDKKPATVVEPFHLTEVTKKMVVEKPKVPVFKAQPVPKFIQNAKTENNQETNKPHDSGSTKRLSKYTPNKAEQTSKNEATATTWKKPTRTQLMPFSFEKRDQALMKKKENFINRILEEEKKAREFHANPLPKAILRSRTNSQDHINETGSTKLTRRSSEDLDSVSFKARPATVLLKKPFEPKKSDNHEIKIEAFNFTTDERIEARHKFDQKIKEHQAAAEAKKKEMEEILKKKEEEEVAQIRKQMEYRAQPVKKYKEIVIEKSNKVTNPISPKFHSDRIRNKENIQASF